MHVPALNQPLFALLPYTNGYANHSANEPPLSLDLLQRKAGNTSDNLPLYSELTPPPPKYETSDIEEQAKTILSSKDFLSIAQILRFRLFRHKDSLQRILENRWDYTLGKILISLNPSWSKYDLQSVNDLKKAQKINAILEIVEPTPSLPACWKWKPSNAATETDIKKIAADIDAESCSSFRRISFIDWLRYAIGYREESVDQLIFQHELLYQQLSEYLRQNPREVIKHLEITTMN